MLEARVGLVINGTIRVAERDRDDFVAAVRQNVAETQLEPGCVYYYVTPDLSDPSVFHLLEGWTDQEALDGHLEGADFLACQEKVARLDILSSVITQFEVVSQKDPIPS